MSMNIWQFTYSIYQGLSSFDQVREWNMVSTLLLCGSNSLLLSMYFFLICNKGNLLEKLCSQHIPQPLHVCPDWSFAGHSNTQHKLNSHSYNFSNILLTFLLFSNFLHHYLTPFFFEEPLLWKQYPLKSLLTTTFEEKKLFPLWVPLVISCWVVCTPWL